MRTLLTVSALALLSNLSIAETFTYEQQVGSPDLDPNIQSLDFKSSGHQASAGDVHVSLDDFYRGNPDVEHVPYNHDGIIIRSPKRLTAYDELSRQNPDLGGV